MDTDFKKLCTPAKIYFTISVFSCIIMLFNRMPFFTVFSKLIVAFIWSFILGWLCNKGYKSISWFLVLLPFIMMFLVTFRIMTHIKEIDSLNPLVI